MSAQTPAGPHTQIMRPDLALWRVDDAGRLQINFHYGQGQAWRSEKRFILVSSGTQGGKTEFGPIWLHREITRRGPGDYLVVTTTAEMAKMKVLPALRSYLEYTLGIARYWPSERMFELRDPETGKFWANGPSDKMWGRILLRTVASPEGLESATAKAAWLDEAGQNKWQAWHWWAILRRLSLHQGRVLITTTPYNLGWLKREVYDRWKAGHPDYDVINFPSIWNPAFPREEFEEARKRLPDWLFEMMYLGRFTRPAGLIYNDFDDSMIEDDYQPTPDQRIVCGVDFGAVHTAIVCFAEDDNGVWHAFREYLGGGISTVEHVEREKREILSRYRRVTYVGGAPSEKQYRMDWRRHGIPVKQPPVSDVEVGILMVTELIRTGRFRVSRKCPGLLSELGSYQREVDPEGNPTERILDKESFHLLDATRYFATWVLARPVVDIR